MISLPTYPKFCWTATGTSHIFRLGLMFKQQKKTRVSNCMAINTFKSPCRHVAWAAVRSEVRILIFGSLFVVASIVRRVFVLDPCIAIYS